MNTEQPDTARPALTAELSAVDFQSFYWLKAELLAFCREQQLATSGSKQALAARITLFLATGARDTPPTTTRRASGAMPTTFTRDSVIGNNWRCSDALRAFFRAEIGPHFHFDQVMRDTIAHGAGKTLQEAITIWQAPRQAQEIGAQFEYNRYLRAFFAAHPAATRADAIRSWNEHKAQRRPPPEA